MQWPLSFIPPTIEISKVICEKDGLYMLRLLSKLKLSTALAFPPSALEVGNA